MINPIIICRTTGSPGAIIIPQHPNRKMKVIHLTIELALLNKARTKINNKKW
jgi:hypothetical protein